jgi:hypothetical protein
MNRRNLCSSRNTFLAAGEKQGAQAEKNGSDARAYQLTIGRRMIVGHERGAFKSVAKRVYRKCRDKLLVDNATASGAMMMSSNEATYIYLIQVRSKLPNASKTPHPSNNIMLLVVEHFHIKCFNLVEQNLMFFIPAVPKQHTLIPQYFGLLPFIQQLIVV